MAILMPALFERDSLHRSNPSLQPTQLLNSRPARPAALNVGQDLLLRPALRGDSQKAQQGHRRGDHPVVAEEARGEITDAAQSFSTESIRGRTHEEPAGCGGTSSRDEQGVQHDANTGRSNGLPTPTL